MEEREEPTPEVEPVDEAADPGPAPDPVDEQQAEPSLEEPLADATPADASLAERLPPPPLEPLAQQPLVLLVNPSSGGGRSLRVLGRVETLLDARRIPFRVVRTKSLEHGIAKTLEAVEAGETPVVISGDGMIGAIGGALATTPAPLGIVPGGRGNDLARVLGIPTEPEAAIEVVLAGESRQIDVGEVNGKPFLGIASVGFDSDANRIANASRFRGNLVYAYAALRALAGWKPARFTIAL